MKRLFGLVWLVLPACAQPAPLVKVRFSTYPEGVSIYQEVSSAEQPGRYLGTSDRALWLDARASQLRLILRAPGFEDRRLTVAPGYFYRHARWPEQGKIRLTPASWPNWLTTRPLFWVALGGLCLVIAYRRSSVNCTGKAPSDQRSACIGDYRLLNLLGEGGFSKVYRAQGPQGPVAIKLLQAGIVPQGGPAGHHPGLVETYHCGVLQGQACVVMELVTGGTLRTQLAAGGLPVPQVARWLSQLLQALSFAHDQGAVHADLKPENLLLTPDGQLKVTDFAGATGSQGTPAYMAPEQLLGQPVGKWTDQYGLALLTYEMLTGNPPVGALARGLQPLPSVSQQRSDLNPRLDSVLERMLKVDPQDRYPSLEEAGQALLEAL